MQNQGGLDPKSMVEMLQRLENDEENVEQEWEDLDSDDEEDEPEDLATRIAGVDLNDADALWERLNDEEKQEFKSLVYNNEIEKLVKEVIPWWEQKIDEQLVEDIEENEKKYREILKSCPKELRSIENLIKKSPNPCIIYNIANVLASYAFLFRYYNGDHESYSLEFVNNFIMICDNIKSNVNFLDNNISTVILSITTNCTNCQIITDKSSNSLLSDDLKAFLKGPKSRSSNHIFSILALSDLLNEFKKVKKTLHNNQKDKAKTEHTKATFTSEFPCNDDEREYEFLQDKTNLINYTKKLEFYLSFMKFEYCKIKYSINWEQ